MPFASSSAPTAPAAPATAFSRSFFDEMRLVIVATAIAAMMTPSDVTVEIYGAQSTCSPPLMKGSSLTWSAWKNSFTPMNARMNAMP